jgi:hypothetical protein
LKNVELETNDEKKTYKPSSKYPKEIEGVFDMSEKATSSSNQLTNSNIRNDKHRFIIIKPDGTINTSDNKKQKQLKYPKMFLTAKKHHLE